MTQISPQLNVCLNGEGGRGSEQYRVLLFRYKKLYLWWTIMSQPIFHVCGTEIIFGGVVEEDFVAGTGTYGGGRGASSGTARASHEYFTQFGA